MGLFTSWCLPFARGSAVALPDHTSQYMLYSNFWWPQNGRQGERVGAHNLARILKDQQTKFEASRCDGSALKESQTNGETHEVTSKIYIP